MFEDYNFSDAASDAASEATTAGLNVDLATDVANDPNTWSNVFGEGFDLNAATAQISNAWDGFLTSGGSSSAADMLSKLFGQNFENYGANSASSALTEDAPKGLIDTALDTANSAGKAVSDWWGGMKPETQKLLSTAGLYGMMAYQQSRAQQSAERAQKDMLREKWARDDKNSVVPDMRGQLRTAQSFGMDYKGVNKQ